MDVPQGMDVKEWIFDGPTARAILADSISIKPSGMPPLVEQKLVMKP